MESCHEIACLLARLAARREVWLRSRPEVHPIAPLLGLSAARGARLHSPSPRFIRLPVPFDKFIGDDMQR